MLGWLPIIGTGLRALILPSITVGLFLAGGLARLVRASIIDVMGRTTSAPRAPRDCRRRAWSAGTRCATR